MQKHSNEWSFFTQHYQDIFRVGQIMEQLDWDTQVYLPANAVAQRGEQSKLLSKLLHELSTNQKYIDTVFKLFQSKSDLTKIQCREIELEKKRVERATKVPASLVGEISQAQVHGHSIWANARKENNFKDFQPFLESIIKLKIDYAQCLRSSNQSYYEVLFEDYEPDLSLQDIENIFTQYKEEFVPLIPEIIEKHKSLPTLSATQLSLSIDSQRQLTQSVLNWMQFDFQSSRVDETAHPFCSGSGSDVRITTRYNAEDWSDSLFSILHEAGHANYQRGIGRGQPRPSPLSQSPGVAIHESQSRFVENCVGRSHAFCEVLAKIFHNKPLAREIDSKLLYNTLNQVKPSFIRVDSDEVTYNLHILLRFELETALISGILKPADLPEAWNEKFKTYLLLDVLSDAKGVLQDVHWSGGSFGYFPTYSIGNFIAAQLFETFQKNLNYNDAIKRGDYLAMNSWLYENVHQHGASLSVNEILTRATGKPLQIYPYIQYVKTKFLKN